MEHDNSNPLEPSVTMLTLFAKSVVGEEAYTSRPLDRLFNPLYHLSDALLLAREFDVVIDIRLHLNGDLQVSGFATGPGANKGWRSLYHAPVDPEAAKAITAWLYDIDPERPR